VHDRQVQVAREVGRLVESAGAPARAVEWHRHGAPRPVEQRAASLAHQPGERLRQRSSSVVFERMDNGAQRAGVFPDRPCVIDGVPGASAADADGVIDRGRTPGRQWIAASVADGRRDRQDRGPAGRADRTVERSVEQVAARRARRREDDGENGVD
jgi:hypothetical protein